MNRNMLLLFLALFCFTTASYCETKHILILHSYHCGYVWTDNLNKTLLENLQQDGQDRQIIVEYLDAMKNSSEQYLDLVEKVFREKYLDKDFKISLIIACDDNALKFLDSRPTIFGNTPIVFCGINNYEQKNFPNIKNFTGVNEAISVIETIDLALKIRPKATKMGVISGTSLTAKRNLQIFKNNSAAFGDKIKITYLSELEPDELVKKLADFSDQDIIVYLSYLDTPQGKHFTITESINLVKNDCQAAIFSFWDFTIPYGVIGGQVVHSKSQGEAAAELALKILAGIPASAIPVMMTSPNKYVFNGQALDNYKISTEQLPRNSIIVNRSAKEFMGDWDNVKTNSFFGYDLFSKHGTIMMLLDPVTGIILDANKAAQVFYGFNSLVGKNISDINPMPPEQMKIEMAKAKELKQNHYHFLHRLADGTVKNVEVYSYPVKIMDTQVLFSIINDVTGMVNAQKSLKRTNTIIFVIILLFLIAQFILIILLYKKNNALAKAKDKINNINLELEERVKERTADLEFANKELESFSYSVSHDLRAPLRTVEGFSTALYEDYYEQINDEGKDYLTRIRNASKHMERLIDDFLNLSRISRKELDLTEINLSKMFNEVATMLVEDINERKIEFIIAPDLVIKGDSNLISILLTQLISNAIKFTAGKEVAIIKLEMVKGDEPDYFRVSDNGVGFDQDYVGKLFAPFQRLHSDAEYPGTGIGLAIAQRIIVKHGGTIFAEGTVGEGASFYFKI